MADETKWDEDNKDVQPGLKLEDLPNVSMQEEKAKAHLTLELTGKGGKKHTVKMKLQDWSFTQHRGVSRRPPKEKGGVTPFVCADSVYVILHGSVDVFESNKKNDPEWIEFMTKLASDAFSDEGE